MFWQNNTNYKLKNNNVLIDEDDFVFIYKKVEIDKAKIVDNIDYKANLAKYILHKYKKEMSMILRDAKPLNDREEVVFRDVFDYGNSYYIGEWKLKE